MKLITTILLTLTICSTAFAWEPSKDFLNYMKRVEGFRGKVYVCEGGYRTIGYGHQIKAGDAFGTLSEQAATELLKRDLMAFYGLVESRYGRLDNSQTEMFLDFYFNLGSMRAFPKMERAILSHDGQSMRREYKRYVHGRELGRNKHFAKYFNL
jgi:GH24 family phage-related lysozyme (muramidase)